MIRQLTGKIAYTAGNFVIVDTGGVGYKVFVAMDTGMALTKRKKPVTFWTHLAVRENVMDLYGFLSKEDLDFFELLLTISGIGPKKAMGILSVASASSARKAIAAGDAAYLQKISGIGKKNAEKLVLELKDKVLESGGEVETFKEEIEAIEALESLGYTTREARTALEKTPSEAKTTSERIKAALTALGK